MSTAEISRHILSLPATQGFTTREVLIYGTRSCIDSALCRMVQSGFIRRLSPGVFVRDNSKEFSIKEIAAVKSKAWRWDVREQPDLVDSSDDASKHQATSVHLRSGHSSSFTTVHGRAYFKGVGPRKWSLLVSPIGEAIYTLWSLGEDMSKFAIRKLTSSYNRWNRQVFWGHYSVMPAWLTANCRALYPPPKVTWTWYMWS